MKSGQGEFGAGRSVALGESVAGNDCGFWWARDFTMQVWVGQGLGRVWVWAGQGLGGGSVGLGGGRYSRAQAAVWLRPPGSSSPRPELSAR